MLPIEHRAILVGRLLREEDVLMDLEDAEGEACAFRASLGGNREELTLVEMCVRATGSEPLVVDQPQDGRYVDGRIRLRRGLSKIREPFTIAHELLHVHFERVGYFGENLEILCDRGGAELAMPREEVRAAIRVVGHSYTSLAGHFSVSESTAVLRIAGVTGRPVYLARPRGAIVRGNPFGWPAPHELDRAARERKAIHLAPIRDEPGKVAYMATWTAWKMGDD